jgi:hypothetical protein
MIFTTLKILGAFLLFVCLMCVFIQLLGDDEP